MNLPVIHRYLVSKLRKDCVNNLFCSRFFKTCLQLQKTRIASGNAATGIQVSDLTPHFSLHPQLPQSQ